MLAIARTFSLLGVEAREVRVEADVRAGLPAFALVGLPDAAVRESRERVRAALSNSGFEFPQQRITANLAPADLRKAGPGFDLAIAAAILAATGQLPSAALADVALAGELALDGSIRAVPGALAMAEAARRAGARAIVVAAASAAEAALVDGVAVIPVERLEQLSAVGGEEEPEAPSSARPSANGAGPDLADLRGQPGLRRGLEVAAAGGHSLLISGPPGAGKSMAARRLPSILPPLGPAEAIEAARVASACGRPVEPVIAGRRPFRAPHHTISTAGLIGGGKPPRPGEVTLAHHGVLFIDELPGVRPRRPSRRCASRSRTAACGSREPDTRWSCRAGSSWSPRRTRAPAGGARTRATAAATPSPSAPTRRSSAARSPTGSTSSSRSSSPT